MGAGHAHGVLVGLHQVAPRLRALEYRDAHGPGGGDLGIVVVGRGGADDEVGPLHVGGVVPDINGNAQGLQVAHGIAFVDVRAGHDDAHALQDFRQGSHGDAADSHQMPVGVFGDVYVIADVRYVHSIGTPL